MPNNLTAPWPGPAAPVVIGRRPFPLLLAICPPRAPLHVSIGRQPCRSVHGSLPPNSLPGRRVLGRRGLGAGGGAGAGKGWGFGEGWRNGALGSGSGLQRSILAAAATAGCCTWSGKASLVCPAGGLLRLFSLPTTGCLLLSGRQGSRKEASNLFCPVTLPSSPSASVPQAPQASGSEVR